ncbi:hypothetical protein C8J57DRAFT_1077401, partial [Mycena rebaudengoi]
SNSDIIHLSVPGASIIVLSSVDATIDLLEQRSAIYSDRPVEILFIPNYFSHYLAEHR